MNFDSKSDADEKLCAYATLAQRSETAHFREYFRKKTFERVKYLIRRQMFAAIESTTRYLRNREPMAFYLIQDAFDALFEVKQITRAGVKKNLFSLAIPLLVVNPAGSVPKPTLSDDAAKKLLDVTAGLFSEQAELALSPVIYEYAEIPISIDAFTAVTKRFAEKMSKNPVVHLAIEPAPVNTKIAVDTRYVLLAAACPEDGVLFRWHTPGALKKYEDVREKALAAWKEGMADVLAPVFAGCNFEVMNPGGFAEVTVFADQRLEFANLEFAMRRLFSHTKYGPGDIGAAVYAVRETGPMAECYIVGLFDLKSGKVLDGLNFDAGHAETIADGDSAEVILERYENAPAHGVPVIVSVTKILLEAGISPARIFYSNGPYPDEDQTFPNAQFEFLAPVYMDGEITGLVLQ